MLREPAPGSIDPKRCAGSMRVVDEGGQRNADGKLGFSYAHPMFWAPYSIVGEVGK